ncbi:kelch-like protein 3 [Eurytemora carolleeae]|uniref:kelch-like protein 3 n=1 Tax=Eurytemora carolleeae TaxID=1294199 RepID=UPI000C781750|nr:kelch-like protein 3 [Eurytemora carolleeae]|eukprot:XP_023333600.1 kelch-like protein 3 [Eurytemora affinis]
MFSVQYEEQVYDAVMTWVLIDSCTRREHLHSLFKEIQWPLIRTPKYYSDTINDPFVMEDKRCARIMEKAEEYFNMSYEEKINYWKENEKPSRWPKLLAALSYAEKLIECYDFEEENSFIITEKPGYVFGSSMCCLHGKLYTIGGVQSKSVDQYDLEKDEWKDFFPSLRHCRVAHGVTTYGNQIFVTGGSAKANANFGPGLYEMEMIELDENSKILHDWKVAGTMKEGRSFLGSAAVNGKVYSIGGCLSEEFSTTEVWNPETGKFSEASKSLSKRDSQGQAVVNGEIYSVGGYDNLSNKYLNSVEKYTPSTDSWSTIPPMNIPRRSPGVVTYKDRIYVVGGMGVDSDLSTIEVYNPTTKEWKMLNYEMKEVNGWCTVCLVDKPVRMVSEPRIYAKYGKDRGFCNLIATGGLDLESLDSDDIYSRRESIASSSGYGDTPTEKVNIDWKATENARTEQRMKHRKELQ